MSKNIPKYEKITPDLNIGLSDDIVRLRKEQKLDNSVKESVLGTYVKIILKNCFTFFNILCLICTIGLLIVHAPMGNFTFVLIFGLNLIIGIFQEIRAKRIVEKLKIVSDSKTTVIRNAKSYKISNSQIVLDDIIMLELGNQIPTDATLIDGSIFVNEALLTGESTPIKKEKGDSILGGSFVVSGKCYAHVTNVGKDTFCEKLSQVAKKHKSPVSKLMNSMTQIIKCISLLIVPIGIVMFFVNYYNLIDLYSGFSLLQQAVTRTATVIIGMIPSGMFLLTTTALSVGIIKLSTHKTLVQDMYALEMLARINVLCLDKTGTITDGKMKVSTILPLCDKSTDEICDVLANLIVDLDEHNETANAIREYFSDKIKTKRQAKVTLPFSSDKKLSGVTFMDNTTYLLGATNFVLHEISQDLQSKIDEYNKLGMRVLLLAMSNECIINDTPPQNLTPVSLIVLEENIRKEAIETINWFKNNQVEVKVISGDDPKTVSQIAMRAGVENAENYIDLTNVSDQELITIAKNYTVFGRVSPQQKQIIVKALKNDGKTVGMTGDGVNDILAMKESDCSITVATGSSAAKSVAKIVLLDDNFNSMPKVVVEGRRVINNIEQTSAIYLMKTFFTMIMAISSIIMRSPYPFEPRHMIALEWAIIGIPPFFISLQPNNKLVQGNFISEVLYNAIPGGLVLIINYFLMLIVGSLVSPPADIFTSMKIIAITLGGLAFLVMLCSPFNKYRTVLIVTDCVFLILWVFCFIDLGVFGLTKMLPVSNYIWNYVIIIGIVIIDFPILYFANALMRKLSQNLRNKLKKVN